MKKIVFLLLSLCLLCSVALAAEDTLLTYGDVTETDSFYSYVTEATRLGLMNGSDDGLFYPYNSVNRAAAVVVLWRMEGSPAPADENWRSALAFSDIDALDPTSPSLWYAEAVAWAKEAGIANGYEDGTFQGAKTLTRQELAQFLYNYAVYKNEPTAKGSLSLYADGDTVAEWAETAFRHVVGMGIFRENEENKLEPAADALRWQLAAALVRMSTPVAG